MESIDREDIHIISQHSNWSEEGVDKALKGNVYNNKAEWQKFLQLFLMSLGVCFVTAGIVFFFAYNWADLHKFSKIGLIEGLLIAVMGIVLFSKLDLKFKNILLTGASMLVGVLFAVFGQIYQTGANAYDFFLGWTMAVTLWVVVANFPALWLLFLVLINTTIIFYAEQVAWEWDESFVMTSLFILNTLALVVFLYFSGKYKSINAPNWFTNIIALTAICLSTTGIFTGILGRNYPSFGLLCLAAAIAYVAGIFYGLKAKRLFYLSIIPFSIIIIITAILIKISDGSEMILFISLFIIGSITFLIKGLLNLQKSWTHG